MYIPRVCSQNNKWKPRQIETSGRPEINEQTIIRTPSIHLSIAPSVCLSCEFGYCILGWSRAAVVLKVPLCRQIMIRTSTLLSQYIDWKVCTCLQLSTHNSLEQHHKTQLRMLSHRWQRLGLQAPIHWDTQEHTPEMKSRPALEIRPIKVSSIVSPKSERPDEIKTVIDSICSSSNNEHLEGNAAERSVESENSDLSDQEKDSIPLLKSPVELNLRPDSSDRDLEPTEIREGEQVYPEVLPFSLKDFELSQSEADDLESQQNLCITDPCLEALATRMIKLEKLQIATIQKEQGKAVRSRPATALVRNSNRMRPMESTCSQANLNEITKLTHSSNSHFKSMNRNRLSSGKVWIGFQQPLALPKKPHSGVVRVKKTEGLVQDVVVYANKSPKCNTPDSSKRCKSTKKAIPKPQKASSEKTSVPAKAPCRKI